MDVCHVTEIHIPYAYKCLRYIIDSEFSQFDFYGCDSLLYSVELRMEIMQPAELLLSLHFLKN